MSADNRDCASEFQGPVVKKSQPIKFMIYFKWAMIGMTQINVNCNLQDLSGECGQLGKRPKLKSQNRFSR